MTDCRLVLQESVERLITSWNDTTQRRKDLNNVNKTPTYEEFEALRRDKKLDSTLKRCSAFVKKLVSTVMNDLFLIEYQWQMSVKDS